MAAPRFKAGDKDYIHKLNQMGETYDDAVVAVGEAHDNATLAGEYKDQALASQNAAKTSETNAASSASAARASQNAAKTSETKAASSASAALASQNAAKASETNAASSASAARASQNAAKASETNADASEAAALASELKSKKWADNPLNTAVETGKYSALHHATKAASSASAALASQNAAKTSETNAADSATASATSASSANASKIAAGVSASNAATSETNAKTSETAAKTSEVNSDASEANALTYRNMAEKWAVNPENTAVVTGKYSALHHAAKASVSATAASNSKTAAASSATASANSATASSNSASAAATSEANALAYKDAAANSASQASTSATNAADSASSAASSAEAAALSAADAAAIAGQAMVYRGPWDASAGVYPSPPTLRVGSVYKVTVAGTVAGTVYKVGDSIIYNGTDWDHIDNTESVTSVAGKTGAVTVTKADVGLGNVRNVVSYSQTEADNLLAGKLNSTSTAVAANKLAIGRTISVSGDASGSVYFDGSSDVTLAVEVQDDSHNHTIANVDGLQTALDGKAPGNHTHDDRYYTETEANSRFLQSGQSGTLSGNLTVTGTVSSDTLTFTRSKNLSKNTDLDTVTVSGFYDVDTPVNGPGPGWWYVVVQRHTNGSHCLQRAWRLDTSTPLSFERTQTGGNWHSWYEVWNSGNDGAGSGLDSDLLDGQHGDFYRDASNLSTGTVPVDRLPGASTSAQGVVQLTSSTSSASTTLAATASAVKAANDNANGRLPSTGGVLTGSLFIQPAGTAYIELGRVDGTASASYIDFHSSGNSIDYDSRIIASGGSTTYGNGSLHYIAIGGHTFTGPVTMGQVQASSFSGTGGSLTGLNGSNISTGTVADARLPSTVVRTSRTVNGKALSSNISLIAADVGAAASNHTHPVSEIIGLDGVGVPTGIICMWSGATTSVPAGWALCNGSNGTPDLRDRFVVGAGSSYAVGNTGGANSVALTVGQLPEHNHSASTSSAGGHGHTGTASSAGSHSHSGSTNSTGAHTHGIEEDVGQYSGIVKFTRAPSKDSKVNWMNLSTLRTTSAGAHSHSLSIDSGGAHTHSLSISSNGAHTHTVSVGNTGSGQAHENRPPYYALAFIMKL